MTRPLIIDDNTRARIAEVKAHAENNIWSLERLKEVAGRMDPDDAIGRNPAYQVEIPMGYRVVYSQENQMHGPCHHISISVDSKKEGMELSLPSIEGVEAIMAQFGMPTMDKCLAKWVEKIDDGGGGAINILALIQQQQ